MDIPDQSVVRRAFVNSSRSRVASASFPSPWPPRHADDLDVVGWADPKAPRRAYLLVGPEVVDELVAIELRLPSGSPVGGRRTMCDLCLAVDAPDGAQLMVAARAGTRGRKGDSVGLCICTDFACSLRVREPLKAHERSVTGLPDERVPALVERVAAFVARVRD